MNANPEPSGDPVLCQRSHVAKLMLWAARLTSLPILAMVLISAVPTLSHFGVSGRDDQVIAVALCVTALGLVAGWKWAHAGGGLILLSIAVVLSQGDSVLNPDPFSLAFGLQGVLFLTSALLNRRGGGGQRGAPAFGWAAKSIVVLLGLCAIAGAAMIFRGPGPVPVPKDKEVFLGVWQDDTGLTVEFTADGHAAVSPAADKPGAATTATRRERVSGRFLAYFRAEDRIELTSGLLGNSKFYQIERYPFFQDKKIKMVLNDTDPYRRDGGVVFVKRDGH